MKIYIQKIAMLRPNFNPRGKNLNLGLDWAVEYRDTDKVFIKYDCILKTYDNFQLNFKTEGVLKLDSHETFIKEEVSQIIFDKSFNIMMEMISLTKDTRHPLISENLNERSYSNMNEFYQLND